VATPIPTLVNIIVRAGTIVFGITPGIVTRFWFAMDIDAQHAEGMIGRPFLMCIIFMEGNGRAWKLSAHSAWAAMRLSSERGYFFVKAGRGKMCFWSYGNKSGRVITVINLCSLDQKNFGLSETKQIDEHHFLLAFIQIAENKESFLIASVLMPSQNPARYVISLG
jgi:hypothetical protein